jgi:hypothetical protein
MRILSIRQPWASLIVSGAKDVENTPQAMKDVMNELRSSRGDAIFPVSLNEATSVAESVEARQPIFRFLKATPKVKMQVVDIHRSPGHHVDGGSLAEILVGRSATRWLRLNG